MVPEIALEPSTKERPQTPTGADTGNLRARRGGTWYAYPKDSRTAFRMRFQSGRLYDYDGFRVTVAGSGAD